LPLPVDVPPPPAIPKEETEEMRAALTPTKRARPLIAIIGINDATELADYLMPSGILRRADVADVVMLATRPGILELYPAALKIEPQAHRAIATRCHPSRFTV
jgi:putative intracellular protease/amidase